MTADLRYALAVWAEQDPESVAARLLVSLDASQIPTSHCPACERPLDADDGDVFCGGCTAWLYPDPEASP